MGTTPANRHCLTVLLAIKDNGLIENPARKQFALYLVRESRDIPRVARRE
jgi:hypothetical protein